MRWLFLTGPARAYKRGEATGGAVPWLHLLVMLGIAAAGGLLGACVGWAVGDLEGGAGAGFMAGLLAFAVWFLYVLGLVAVMRFRGRRLESLVGSDWLRRHRRW
jgi:hypothetical protein